MDDVTGERPEGSRQPEDGDQELSRAGGWEPGAGLDGASLGLGTRARRPASRRKKTATDKDEPRKAASRPKKTAEDQDEPRKPTSRRRKATEPAEAPRKPAPRRKKTTEAAATPRKPASRPKKAVDDKDAPRKPAKRRTTKDKDSTPRKPAAKKAKRTTSKRTAARKKRPTSGSLAELIGKILAGKATGEEEGSPLTPILERLAKGLGLSSGASQTVVGYIVGKLLARRLDVTPGGTAADARIEDLLGRWESGEEVDAAQVRASGMADELARELDIDPGTAASVMAEVLAGLEEEPA